MKKEAPFKAYSITDVFDKDGKLKKSVLVDNPNNNNKIFVSHRDSSGVIKNEFSFNMKSFTYNWAKWLYTVMGICEVAITDADGDTYTTTHSSLRTDGDYEDDTVGIIVGSDEGSFYPMDEDNTHIGTQLRHGVNANELVYHETYIRPVYESGSEYLLEISRVFTNENANPVTIKEIALYSYITGSTCITRDVEDDNGDPIELVINSYESIEIRYVIKITKYSGFTKNFLSGLWGFMENERNSKVYYNYSSKDTTVVDTTNNPQTIDARYVLQCNAPIYEDDYGIVVGSGLTTFDFDSTQLYNRILEGSTEGTVKYFITEFTVNKNSDDNTIYETHIKRSIVNDYEDDITITEAGLYGVGTSSNRIMLMGVNYPSGITLSEHESMRVNFIIQTGL